MRPTRFFALAVALALLAAGAPVRATTPAAPSEAEVQSRQSFQTAEEHFKAGRFTEALAAYQAGYDRVPLPGFLINIAQCYRRLGDLTRARASYRKFILVAPDSPFVPQVKTLIEELDQLAIDLDGAPRPAAAVGTAPPPALQAHDSETTAGAPGPALVAVPAAPAANSTSSSKHRWWLWGSVGAAVAIAATTTFFVLRTPDANTVHDGTLGTLRR